MRLRLVLLEPVIGTAVLALILSAAGWRLAVLRLRLVLLERVIGAAVLARR